MRKPRFQHKLTYSILIQALSMGLLASSISTTVNAAMLHLSGDLTGSNPYDIYNSGIIKIELDKETRGAQIYVSKAYTLKTTAGDTAPLVFVRSGSEIKLNTSDITDANGVPQKNDKSVLKITGSGSETAAIWIGRELPPSQQAVITDKDTVFKGQYLDIIQTNGVGIDGEGSQNSQGGSTQTTLSLKDSKITAQEGILWGDYTSKSLIELSDVTITADNTGMSISSSQGSETKLVTDKLKITSKGVKVGVDPGTGLFLGGAGMDASLNDTTIISKTSGVRVSNLSKVHFTGSTVIEAADSKSTGQNGIMAGRDAEVTVDHLEMFFQSEQNSDYSGAISASSDASITIGQTGQSQRSKIEVFNLKNASRSNDVQGANAFLGGKITLNSVDMVNFRKKTLGEEISDKVLGLDARYNSHITLNDSTVTLKDLKDEPFIRIGASIQENSTLTLNQGSRIEAGQFAVRMTAKSSLEMNDSSLQAGRSAIYAQSTTGDKASSLLTATLNNSQVTALQQKAKDPLGTALQVGMEIYGKQAYLQLDASNGSVIEGDYLYQVNQGELELTAKQSLLSGAARIAAPTNPGDPRNIANLQLSQGSIWQLKKDPNPATVPTAADYVQVNTLSLDDSEVHFAKPADIQGFQTLNVDTLNGNNGLIELWTELQDDSSATDQLIVRNQATGTTRLRIKRFDDEMDDGAQTKVGIKVVSADSGTATNTATTSATAFSLDSGSTGYRASSTPSLVAGLYDYYLVKGGKGGEAESWYLNSIAGDPVIPDPDPAPDPGPGPDPDPGPGPGPEPDEPTAYRPEIDAYFSNRQMALSTQRHRWQERQEARGPGRTAWARLVHKQERFDNQFGNQRKMDNTLIHFGSDVWQNTYANQSQLSLGVMALYSDGKSKTHNERLKAEGKVQGYNLGLYATWQQKPADPETGAYVDSWVMQGWFRNKVKGDGLAEEKYNSRSLSASLEGGYGFLLSDSGQTRYYLQPQAQVIWSNFNASDVYEQTQTQIHKQNMNSAAYRVGLRFKADIEGSQGMQLAPFAELNYWRMPRISHMSFNDKSVGDPMPKHVMATTLGLNAQLSKSTSAFGRVSYMMGSEKYRESNFQLGIRYAW